MGRIHRTFWNLLGLATVGVALLASCGPVPTAPGGDGIVGLRFLAPVVELPEGEAAPLVLQFVGPGGGLIEPPAGTRISWTTSASSIAEVAADGRVLGVREGEAVVTASAGAHRAAARVLVLDRGDSTLVAGGLAVLAWGGFSTRDGGNEVVVAGRGATVLSASEEELRVLLPPGAAFPCRPTEEVEVRVVSDGVTRSRSLPLRVGSRVRLTIGEAALLGASAAGCVELEAGAGYAVTVVNTATSAAVQTPFGVAGQGAARPSPSISASASAFRGAESPRSAPMAREEAGSAAHLRVLESSRAVVEAARAVRDPAGPGPAAGLAASLGSVTLRVGDRVQRRAPVAPGGGFGGCAQFSSVEARVAYAGARLLILEDIASPTAGALDARYAELGAEFEQRMLPLLGTYFGDLRAHPAMRDRPVEILATPLVNAYGAGGFAWSGDLLAPAACAASNGAGVMYLAVPMQPSSIAGWWRSAPGIVMHEAKHLVSYAERLSRNHPLEESWLEEATARAAEEIWGRALYGYRQGGNTTAAGAGCGLGGTGCAESPRSVAAHFAHLRDVYTAPGSRTPFGNPTGADLTFYGNAWWLVRYAADHAGRAEAEFFRALVAGPRRGAENLAAQAGTPIEELLGHWALANLLDDRPDVLPASPKHAHPSWSSRDVLGTVHGSFPLTVDRLAGTFAIAGPPLRAGAAWYAEIDAASPQTLSLGSVAGGDAPATMRLGIARVR
jgi:hypothetical protein